MQAIKDKYKIITNKISNNLTKKIIYSQIKIPNILTIQTATFKIKANNNYNLHKMQQLTKKNIKLIMIKVNHKISQNHSKMVHLTVSIQKFKLIQKIWDNIK